MASCPSHRGVEGLVVLETKNTLQILGNNFLPNILLAPCSSAPLLLCFLAPLLPAGKDNTLRLLPKLGSSFSYCVGGYLFTLPGASIDSKPAERATKKLKNKIPLDF